MSGVSATKAALKVLHSIYGMTRAADELGDMPERAIPDFKRAYASFAEQLRILAAADLSIFCSRQQAPLSYATVEYASAHHAVLHHSRHV